MARVPSVDSSLLAIRAEPSLWRGLGGGRDERPSHRHMQQRFSKDETKPPDSYCLHLFSAQKAELVPPWTWGHTGPLPPLALTLASPAATPTARPHSKNGGVSSESEMWGGRLIPVPALSTEFSLQGLGSPRLGPPGVQVPLGPLLPLPPPGGRFDLGKQEDCLAGPRPCTSSSRPEPRLPFCRRECEACLVNCVEGSAHRFRCWLQGTSQGGRDLGEGRPAPNAFSCLLGAL